jgi:hypothetical protein
MLNGYCKDLPVKRGDRVFIKKGTRLTTTHPNREPWVAKKSYWVEVNHTLCGMSVTVGCKYPGKDERIWTGHTDSDLLGYASCLGINTLNSRKAIEELYSRAVEREATWPMNGPKGTDLVVHVMNPTVRWAGAGGYWVEADINDVTCEP